MEIKVIFQVDCFKNLVRRENWLNIVDDEVKELIGDEVNRINFSNEPGEQLKRVCLIICKYTAKKLNPLDVANMIAWNCAVINVK